MNLSNLRAPEGARHTSKRLGRGHGSGRMKTSGRGQKGQMARTGAHIPAYFEGGQTRFSIRMPYLGGFKNRFRIEYRVLNLRDLRSFAAGDEVNAQTLVARGLIRPGDAEEPLKILGEGTVDRPLRVTVQKISESARSQIEAAGGSVTLLTRPTRARTKRSGNPAPHAPTATR